MTIRERLTEKQIILIRSLIKRGAQWRAVSIEQWQRFIAIPLWRRGLVGVWYRQAPSEQPSLQGPYYALTIEGARLAAAFLNPAPRGSSGAEQVS